MSALQFLDKLVHFGYSFVDSSALFFFGKGSGCCCVCDMFAFPSDDDDVLRPWPRKQSKWFYLPTFRLLGVF